MREREALVAAFVLLAIAIAGVLAEGAVVREQGGWLLAAAGVAGAAWCLRAGIERPARATTAAAVVLLAVVVYQLAPVPMALRRLVAPGQAAWLDRVGEGGGDLDAWLGALSAFDVEAALGTAGPWSYDTLAGAKAAAWHAGAIAPAEATWTLALALGCLAIYAAGSAIGRSERAAFAFSVALLLFGVGESLFGIANRNGGTTGLHAKWAYLGSATGTLVNRGHFASVLCLSLGAAWGLSACLFPLLPEEVRKHAMRKRRSSQPPGVLEASGSKIPRLALLAFLSSVLAVGLVAAQSRGPLIGFGVAAAAVGAWMTWRREERWHLGLGVGLPAAGVALAVVAFGVRGALGRFVGILKGGDDSVLSRARVWRESLHAVADAPILGHGLGSFRDAWSMHEAGTHLYDFGHAHGEPVEILVEVGVVGAVAVAVACGTWLRGVARDVDVAPQSARTALGAGLAVGVLAVALQSFGDFPLRVPGVALLFALVAGVARGALRGEEAAPTRAGAVPVVLAGLGAVAFGVPAALADAGFPGDRDARIGEVGRAWYEGEQVHTLSQAKAWRKVAEAEADRDPLDPWAHAAEARAAALVAAGGWKGEGGTPEDDAFAADRAAARALALRPRDPRLELALSTAFVALARTCPTPDAWRERAVALLVDAVARDAWRAQEAFTTATTLPDADLARIGGAAAEAGRPRARLLYEYGRALEKRGRKDDALDAFQRAWAEDASFGSPAFNAGILLLGKGDAVGARAMFKAFLGTNDRPIAMEGWALLHLERVDEAEARFRRAVVEVPTNRWAWEGVAQVAQRQGDARREREAWERILAMAPNDANVKAKLNALEPGPPAR